MTTAMIETGVTPARVVAAAEQVNSLLRAQPGFISRQLGLADDGAWRDILYGGAGTMCWLQWQTSSRRPIAPASSD